MHSGEYGGPSEFRNNSSYYSPVELRNKFQVLEEKTETDERNEIENIEEQIRESELHKRKKPKSWKYRSSTRRHSKGKQSNEEPIVDNKVASKETKNKSHDMKVYSALEPQKLLMLPVKINEHQVKALIDSGATSSLISEDVIKTLQVDKTDEETIEIRGLGTSLISTLGNITLKLTLYDKNLQHCSFKIVEDSAIDVPMILGLDFLKSNKMTIDMKRRVVTCRDLSNAITKFYVDGEGAMARVVEENIPVYAAESVKLKNEVLKIPIIMNVTAGPAGNEDSYYYRSEFKNKKVEGIDGIIGRNGEKHIMIQRIGSESNNEMCIKKGDKVGSVSTIIEMEEDEAQCLDSKWSMEDIKDIKGLSSQLTDEEREKVHKMLLKTSRALSKNDNDIGMAQVTPHTIELTDSTPIWQRPRRFAEPINKEIENQCEELKALDIIEFSNSQWSSPIVPVRKKDGQLRLCVDYRKVNSVTKEQKFPMPNLSDSIYAAHNMNYFSKLDLIKGYYQVPIDKDSRQYTAFSTPHNHYQFKVLSFGLRNSGIAFQKTMQDILSDYCFKNIIVYIDDILIMTETFEEHINLVSKVLATLMNNGIKVKINKCELFKQQVSFLGHIISNRGIQKAPEYIEKVKNYPKPTTVTELRQFLGLVNFQRKFIDNCSLIAKPLSELTGGPKRKKLIWSEEMNKAFQNLKDKLVEDVTLAFPDYSKQANKLELFVDASSKGAGACLVQKQNNIYCTIGYASTTFSDTETRYSTIDRELIAIKWGIKIFRAFLFGVAFILYTDHKPLIYLHNMSRENSRLMRAINDLADYTFEIRYRPGKDNSAADAMSRIVDAPTIDEYNKLINSKELPKGLFVPKLVEGGGDSMIESLLICMEEIQEELVSSIPVDKSSLRKELVECILENSKLFNIKLNKENKKQFSIMKEDGQLPCNEMLLAACKLYNLEIWVHYGISSPIVYKIDSNSAQPIIHLQCLAGIHFNPVISKSSKSLNVVINEKNVNILYHTENNTNKVNQEMSDGEMSCEDMQVLYTFHKLTNGCSHTLVPSASCIVRIGEVKFCALIDTGAQVSLLSETVWKEIKDSDNTLEMVNGDSIRLNSVGNWKTPILGVVHLIPSILNIDFKGKLPFAIVDEASMPCCCLLGANFLVQNNITVDFEKSLLNIEEEGDVITCPLETGREEITCRININSFLGAVFVSSGEESDYNLKRVKIKFAVSEEDLIVLQNKDYAIRSLKKNIKSKIPTSQWKKRCINQFKRTSMKLTITENGLLVKTDANNNDLIPVISFPLLVEIAVKLHTQVAHIGKHKLIDLIAAHFYHPAIGSVATDVCTSCQHCQLFKIGRQTVSPPTLKINANGPYDLIAMDLLQFNRSSTGNIAILVVIDHFSKFLFAVPIRNKRSDTVAKVVKEDILPKMLKVPNRVLTDNGPEFRSVEFNSTLQEYNIDHIYSTSYKAASNGAVERSNRTIIELLKGIVSSSPLTWDKELGKAVVLYNNTLHTKLGTTPSKFILQNSFKSINNLPLNADIIATWKEGHPHFSPFRLHQKVVRKVNRVGNRLSHKLKQKYEGPYEVVKVQSNGVSYEIRDLQINKIIKVHHTQLKAWKEPPNYLKKYMDELKGEGSDIEEAEEELQSTLLGGFDSSSGSESESFCGFEDGNQRANNELSCTPSDSSRSVSGSYSGESQSEISSCLTKEESEDDVQEEIIHVEGSEIDRHSGNSEDGNDGNRQNIDTQQPRETCQKSNSMLAALIEDDSKVKKQVTFKENSKQIPLIDLHCSERINYEEIEVLNHREEKISSNERNCSSIKSIDSHLPELNNNKISTPYKEINHNSGLKWSISALEENPIDEEVDSKERASIEKEITVFDWLQNTLTLQEEIIAELIESQQKEVSIEEKSRKNQPNLQVDQQALPAVEVLGNEESFSGFGENISAKQKTSAKIQALQLMKQQLGSIRQSNEDFRFGGNEIIRQIWKNRYMGSETRLDVGSSTTDSQSKMGSGVIRQLTYSNHTGIVTRSRGTVHEYANVQTKPIEYKSYGKKTQRGE